MMETHRNLGRTGVKVSPLCLGCMMFGGKTDAEQSYAIIDRALDAGINFLDTADVYSAGKSEEVTGEALRRNGRRDQVVLATKVHGRMGPGANDSGNSAKHIIAGCEASLRRLKTDYIDLYQIHRPQREIPIDETLRALDRLIRDGKILYAGTSTFAAWQLMESLAVSKELGLHRFICDQPPYNLLDRRIERELVPFALTHGFALIPWSPLAGGLLSGKYKANQPAPQDSRFAEKDRNPVFSNRLTKDYWEKIGPFLDFCETKGHTPSQIALAWCAQKPGITSAIIGPRTMEQLKDNLLACEIVLTDEDHRTLDALFPPGRMVSPFYEADFGPHLYR